MSSNQVALLAQAARRASFQPFDAYHIRARWWGYLIEMCRARDPDQFGDWHIVARRFSYAAAVKLAAAMKIMNPQSK